MPIFCFQEELFEWSVLSFVETGSKQYSRYIIRPFQR